MIVIIQEVVATRILINTRNFMNIIIETGYFTLPRQSFCFRRAQQGKMSIGVRQFFPTDGLERMVFF